MNEIHKIFLIPDYVYGLFGIVLGLIAVYVVIWLKARPKMIRLKVKIEKLLKDCN